jgi:hypothetical protein
MITTIDECQELATMADTAEECLQSLRFGSHWLLKQRLARYGVFTASREADIKAARRLCDEFIAALEVAE